MAATLAVLTAVLAACGAERPDRLVGAVREPRPDVGQVTLLEAGAGPFRFEAEPGHVLLTYFGYTSCPDVCPTTLADLKVVYEDLGAAAERVDLAMVTIDPEVDTAGLLTAYVRSFVPGAHAIVSTDDVALRRRRRLRRRLRRRHQRRRCARGVPHRLGLRGRRGRGDPRQLELRHARRRRGPRPAAPARPLTRSVSSGNFLAGRRSTPACPSPDPTWPAAAFTV
ncbi:MAG: SCO family protein [Acidimicrobiales bacterium]